MSEKPRAGRSETVDASSIVERAFAEWMDGTGSIESIFATDMTWEIVGESKVAGRYPGARSFAEHVLHPFASHFREDDPFRPVRIRRTVTEGDTVVVIWEGRGTTRTGTTYSNTYAWTLTLHEGRVVDATAFFDSIAFDRLWTEPAEQG